MRRGHGLRGTIALLGVLSLMACASQPKGTSQGAYKVGKPYKINGVWYYPSEDYSYDETGIGSWYGPGFHSKATANGETYDENDMTAAHKTLPMPCLVRVTNLGNGRSVVVRVNDRGPYVNNRIIDMSRRGAQLLGYEKTGTAKVRVQILADESRQIAAAARQGKSTTAIAAAATRSGDEVASAPDSGRAWSSPRDGGGVYADGPSAEVNGPSVGASTGASVGSRSRIEVASLPPPGRSSAPVSGGGGVYADGPSVTAGASTGASAGSRSRIETASLPPPGRSTASASASGAIYSGEGVSSPAVPGAVEDGRFIPAPVVVNQPVRNNGGQIYVQVGAFGSTENVTRAQARLSKIGQQAQISTTATGGQRLQRVRVGPMETVEKADTVLAQMIQAGLTEAKIIVE